MRTFKLLLAYDGGAYSGWQTQLDRRTVQGTIEERLQRILGTAVHVVGSGRTDAGVHALGQVASFRAETHLTPEVLQRALNAELPEDIRVQACQQAPDAFHAITSAVRKRYRYVLHDGPVVDVFRRRYAWHQRTRLDAEAMHESACGLRGTHDFRSFETHWPNRTTSVRTILDTLVHRQADGAGDFIHVEVEADGFLYNMVRTIVGTLVQVGRGLQPVSWPAEVVAAQDRRVAGMTAPPHALYLLWVDYGGSDLISTAAGLENCAPPTSDGAGERAPRLTTTAPERKA